MAGGGRTPGSESGEYNTTAYAKQGDVGSNLPAVQSTVWKAGGLGLTGWFIRANHGTFDAGLQEEAMLCVCVLLS